MKGSFRRSKASVTIMKRYDLCVVGSGLTGVAAAVVAARRGLSVLLVERSGCLGGAMANCLVYPFDAVFHGDRERLQAAR